MPGPALCEYWALLSLVGLSESNLPLGVRLGPIVYNRKRAVVLFVLTTMGAQLWSGAIKDLDAPAQFAWFGGVFGMVRTYASCK